MKNGEEPQKNPFSEDEEVTPLTLVLDALCLGTTILDELRETKSRGNPYSDDEINRLEEKGENLVEKLTGLKERLESPVKPKQERFLIREAINRASQSAFRKCRNLGFRFSQNISNSLPVEAMGSQVDFERLLRKMLSFLLDRIEGKSVYLGCNKRIVPQRQVYALTVSSDAGWLSRGDISSEHYDEINQLARSLGGWIESGKSDHGEEIAFLFSLPEDLGAVKSLDAVGEDGQDLTETSPDATANSGKNKLLILLVDDSEDNNFLMQCYLTGIDADTHVVMDGATAVEFCAKHEYDVIFMDIQMPVMDGLKATGEIRKLEREQGREPVPVIAVSAHAYDEDCKKSLEAGCMAHLSKPVSKEAVWQALENAIGYNPKTKEQGKAE